MSRILLAWELGTGFGHLGPFLGLAPRLLERGHSLHVAAREIAGAAQALGNLPVELHQAPLCLNTYGGLQEPPLNYAEILMRYGYLEPVMLQAMIAAWRPLIRATAADLVLADHAPTALLAARDLGVARAVIGSTFNVPQAVAPTPNMRPWLTVPAERLADSDRRVLEVINQALPPDRGLRAMHDIFAGAARFFSGKPELDACCTATRGLSGSAVVIDPLGSAVMRAGAGRVVHPDDNAPDIAAELAAMLGDGAYGRNARALAAHHGGPSVGTMTDRAVARIEALALPGAGPSP